MTCALGHVLIPDSASEHTNLTVTFVLFQPLALAAGVATTAIVGGVVSMEPARLPPAVSITMSVSARVERRAWRIIASPSTSNGERVSATARRSPAGRRGYCQYKRGVLPQRTSATRRRPAIRLAQFLDCTVARLTSRTRSTNSIRTPEGSEPKRC